MNRRSFVVSLLVLIPSVKALAAPKGISAIDYLTKALNAACKGRGADKGPITAIVSQDLYDALRRETKYAVRFNPSGSTEAKAIKFKYIDITVNPKFKGWDYAFGWKE